MRLPNILIYCYLISLSVFLTGCAEILESIHVDRGSVEVHSEQVDAHVGFGYKDRKTIQRYYPHGAQEHTQGLPPGLAKRRHLPPGLAKRIEHGQSLPPGLDRNYLPEDLEEQLSPLPKGYVRLKVGGSIVILDQETDVVIDVIRDIE